MPQPKKDPSLRARSNKATTAKSLDRADTHKVPALPAPPDKFGDDGELAPRNWHPQTIEWWTTIWESPLPGAWESFDTPTLYMLALLVNDIWTAKTSKDRKDALSEYRLQRRDFFIAPYDRLRGEIVFADAADARERTARRQFSAVQPSTADDPRNILGQ